MKNDSVSVTLLEILESKEERAMYQRELISVYHCPVVSFTVVMPGNVKRNEKSRRIFEIGKEKIEKALQKEKIVFKNQIIKSTGEEAYYCVDMLASDLKRVMTSVEEENAVSRLFDIDVIDLDYKPVSRESLGLPQRRCLVCDCDAHICARERRHSVDGLLHKIEVILSNE